VCVCVCVSQTDPSPAVCPAQTVAPCLVPRPPRDAVPADPRDAGVSAWPRPLLPSIKAPTADRERIILYDHSWASRGEEETAQSEAASDRRRGDISSPSRLFPNIESPPPPRPLSSPSHSASCFCYGAVFSPPSNMWT